MGLAVPVTSPRVRGRATAPSPRRSRACTCSRPPPQHACPRDDVVARRDARPRRHTRRRPIRHVEQALHARVAVAIRARGRDCEPTDEAGRQPRARLVHGDRSDGRLRGHRAKAPRAVRAQRAAQPRAQRRSAPAAALHFDTGARLVRPCARAAAPVPHRRGRSAGVMPRAHDAADRLHERWRDRGADGAAAQGGAGVRRWPAATLVCCRRLSRASRSSRRGVQSGEASGARWLWHAFAIAATSSLLHHPRWARAQYCGARPHRTNVATLAAPRVLLAPKDSPRKEARQFSSHTKPCGCRFKLTADLQPTGTRSWCPSGAEMKASLMAGFPEIIGAAYGVA